MIVAAERAAAVQIPRLPAIVRRPGFEVAPLRRPADMDPYRRLGLIRGAAVACQPLGHPGQGLVRNHPQPVLGERGGVAPLADQQADPAAVGPERGVLSQGLIERGVVPAALQRRRHPPPGLGQVQAEVPPVGIAVVFVVKPLLEIRHGLAQRLAASLRDRQDPGSSLVVQLKVHQSSREAQDALAGEGGCGGGKHVGEREHPTRVDEHGGIVQADLNDGRLKLGRRVGGQRQLDVAQIAGPDGTQPTGEPVLAA